LQNGFYFLREFVVLLTFHARNANTKICE
jgi:hypothetical protein